MKPLFTAAIILVAGITGAFAQDSKSSPDAKVYFVNLKDGDSVSSPVNIKFGLSGMGIAPAGIENDLTKLTGHHHLLINSQLDSEGLKAPIPADEKHLHFGKGQTEATVTLPAGKHTIQLVLGDWTHIPHDKPVMSDRITITVK